MTRRYALADVLAVGALWEAGTPVADIMAAHPWLKSAQYLRAFVNSHGFHRSFDYMSRTTSKNSRGRPCALSAEDIEKAGALWAHGVPAEDIVAALRHQISAASLAGLMNRKGHKRPEGFLSVARRRVIDRKRSARLAANRRKANG